MSNDVAAMAEHGAPAMRTEVFGVAGGATSDEVAAIAAALELLWPENSAPKSKPDHDFLAWRFSARPWLARTVGAQRVWTR